MATTNFQGQIPSSTTAVQDKQGRISNPWYFWFLFLQQQAQSGGGGGGGGGSGQFVGDGSFTSYGPTTIYQGSANEISTFGTKGNILFALDTLTTYVYGNGAWHAMIPEFIGDASNAPGSNVLTLATINPDPGTFTNATVTVNGKGLVTSVASGVSNGSVGSQFTIQLAGAIPGTFDGDDSSFTYNFLTGGAPILTVGNATLPAGPIIDLNGPPGVGDSSQINANTTLALIGLEGMTFTAGSTNWITLTPAGTIELQGASGTSGQVLTTQGSGSPAHWTSVVNSFDTTLSGLTPTTATTGAVTLSGVLGIPSGGTGQTTSGAAFNALSPLTTKGDILGYSTTNARIPVGVDGQVLIADSGTPLGVIWSTPASIPQSSVFAGDLNCGLVSDLNTICVLNMGPVNLTASNWVNQGKLP